MNWYVFMENIADINRSCVEYSLLFACSNAVFLMLLYIITRIEVVVEAETFAHIVKFEFLPRFRLWQFLLATVAAL